MSTPLAGNWLPEQQRRLDEFNTSRCVDIHCHCLPGLDDGPATMDEALALCEELARDGVTTVVASPHQLGRYDRLNSASVIREAVAALVAALASQQIPLEVFAGGDVRIDERLPRLLEADEILTVADAGYHLLLELPHELFVDPLPTIDVLRERGLQSILTHPERHAYLYGTTDWAVDWIKHGAVLQITAGSLLGDFGSHAFEQAWQLVERGLVSLVATDAHDTRRRPPRLTAALTSLAERIGADAARALVIDNPQHALDGRPIELSQSFS
jgi:protein-tyrosine phosphatase